MYVTKGVDWPLVPKFHLNKSEAPFCETKRVPQEDCIFHFSFFHSLHERISDEESFKVPADELKLWESRHERISDEDSFKVPADELKLGESRHKRLHWWASFGENLHFGFFHSLHEGICDEKSFKSPCRWAQIGRLEAWKVSLLDLFRRRILHPLPEEIFDGEVFKVPAGEQIHCVICLVPQTSRSSFSSGRYLLAVAGSLLSLHSQVRGTLACLQSGKNRGQ